MKSKYMLYGEFNINLDLNLPSHMRLSLRQYILGGQGESSDA